MGSYLFANQYQNEVIPDEERRFKADWLRYYHSVPNNVYRFAFIDPAIGQKNSNDFTGIVVVAVAPDTTWYIEVAERLRLTPTQIIDRVFRIQEQFRCMGIGVESVAYQEALLYFIDEESKRRQKNVPVKGINQMGVRKETRILSLVPRFENGRILLKQGMSHFEDELMNFPRGAHDDIIDACASLEEIVFYPEHEKVRPIEKPNSPHDPNYERWVIQNYGKRQQEE